MSKQKCDENVAGSVMARLTDNDGEDVASGNKAKIEELKKSLDEHYHREIVLLEESLSLEEDESKEVLEFIVNNRWWKALKEMKEHVKRGASKAKRTIRQRRLVMRERK